MIDREIAYTDDDYVIIATPTNYDQNDNNSDTNSIDAVIEDVLPINSNSVIVIKSILSVGCTNEAKGKYKTDNIISSPEFWREGENLL